MGVAFHPAAGIHAGEGKTCHVAGTNAPSTPTVGPPVLWWSWSWPWEPAVFIDLSTRVGGNGANPS
jgi:hypothetical protein